MNSSDADAVLASLQGKKIVIADLNAIFSGWPRKVNPNLDKLRQDLDVWLESMMGHSKYFKSSKTADFARFGATWWPQASMERLRIVTYLAAWLFFLDDEIDMDNGCFRNDFERSQEFRAETIRYVRVYLGLSSEQPPKTPSPIVGCFEIIGNVIRDAYDIEQRERLSSEIETFIQMTEREQSLHLSSTVPSAEEYWEYRLGSSAVCVILAVNEFAWGDMKLPRSVKESADMRFLWSRTNMVISTVNDLLSLKKEIAHSSVESLVPLLCTQSDNVQAAVDRATGMLVENVGQFEEAVRQLSTGNDASGVDVHSQLLDSVHGCRLKCTGNLTWSLLTPRYGINCEDTSDGVSIQL